MDDIRDRMPAGLPFHGLAAAIALILYQPSQAQPCNPVIDGTYCATQMPRGTAPVPARPTMSAVGEMTQSISPNADTPGTFGAISFRGGSTCIGLLTRGACK
jgi:hypothetical protein